MDKLESRAAEVDAVIVKLTKKIESLEKQLAEVKIKKKKKKMNVSFSNNSIAFNCIDF